MDLIGQAMEAGERARREGRLDVAALELARAAERARRLDQKALLVRALKGLAQIERDLGRREAALPLYEEAVALARELGDERSAAHTVRHVGDVHRHQGRVPEAEACYLEALRLYRGRPDTPPLELANALRPLALLRTEQGLTDEARRLWTEARDLYAAAGVEVGVAECEDRIRGDS